MSSNPTGTTNRRTVLKAIGGSAAVATLAGCLGDDDDQTRMRVGHIGEGSMGGNGALGLQTIARNHLDHVTISPQGTGGDVASIRLSTEGELEGHVGALGNYLSAVTGTVPFDEDPVDVEDLPHQVMAPGLVEHAWFQLEGTGLENSNDMMTEDVNIWPLPPEFGARGDLVEVMQMTEVDGQNMYEAVEDRIIDVSSDDIGGAVQEGRIDVFVIIQASRRGLPSYSQQVAVNADLEYLAPSDEWYESINNFDAFVQDSWDVYGFDQDVGTDHIEGWNTPLQFTAQPDISDEVVYDILSAGYEHTEEFQDVAATNVDLQNIDAISSVSEDAPVHGGAQEFFEEQGVDTSNWPDEW